MRLNSEFLARGTLEALGFLFLGENVLVHHTAVMVDCEKISLGVNTRIDPYVVISVRGGLIAGRNVHIGAHCCLTGAASIELADFCGLSQGVRIFSSSDDYSGDSLTNPTVPDVFKSNKSLPVRLGRHSIVGANSIILPGSDIGDGVAVGALSLVNRNLDAWSIYAGAPARLVRKRNRRALELEGEYLREK